MGAGARQDRGRFVVKMAAVCEAPAPPAMVVRNIRTKWQSEAVMTPSRGQVLLFPEDVAEIWTEERRKTDPDAPAVPVDRVHDFLRWSKPTPAGVKRKHRYADHPMPYPRGIRGKKQPAWHGDQEDDLRAFWHDRLPDAPADDAALAQRRRDWAEALTGSQS